MKKGDYVIDMATGRNAIVELTNSYLALIVYLDKTEKPLRCLTGFCFVSLELLVQIR